MYKNPAYIVNLLLGITFWFLIATIGIISLTPQNYPQILTSMSIEFVIALLLGFIIARIYLNVLNIKSNLLRILSFILGTIVFITIWGGVTGFVWLKVYQLSAPQNFIESGFVESITNGMGTYIANISNFSWLLNAVQLHGFFIVTLTGIFLLTWFRENYYNEYAQTQQIKSREKEALLKMLRYQINPHFLFNTLNTIHALIDENSENARKLVKNIHSYYQITLNQTDQMVSLKDEIEAVSYYMQILKIRFEEKFEYTIDYDNDTGDLEIPSFIIYLLVENAVKFGIKTSKEKLTIALKVSVNDSKLLIEVNNSGKLVPADELNFENKGTGTGIENIKSRLKLFYEDLAMFNITESNGCVKAKIEILISEVNANTIKDH